MNRPLVLRSPLIGLLVAGLLVPAGRDAAGASRRVEPSQVVPLDRLAPQHRDAVAEIIRDHTFHRKGAPESFPCHQGIYLNLLNEPTLTLALWQDLSSSPVQLRQIGPDRYHGTDGAGASATWEFVLRSPKLHVLLCDLDYTGPRGNARLEARLVLIVHSGFYREVNGEHWVQHDVEAYVKVDSKGWKAVARTIRPLLEKLLEDQVQEAGWFVSLMGRLVEAYPNWAAQVAATRGEIRPDARQKFRDTLAQNRRPGAFAGRPTLVDNSDAKSTRRR